MKLLLIDDHAASRKLIREIVTCPDDAVCECHSGEEALECAGAFDPDVVTIDLMLGGMSGFSALRQLRRLCPRARLVVVTSYDEPSLRLAALGLGAVAFVSKDRLVELRGVIADAASSRPTTLFS